MNASGSSILLSCFGLALCAPISAQTTQRVSVNTAGGQAIGGSEEPSVSADGRYVAFHSGASNLVPNDNNAKFDVFVRDRQGGVTTRVSLGPGGLQANAHCLSPSISADGNFVAFRSAATNLVTEDTNSRGDVFVHNRLSGVTERVSVGPAGVQGDFDSTTPSISGDGRYVAFGSYATNLVAGDTNGVQDVFLRDRVTATTECVSISTTEVQGNGVSRNPSVSADGRYVAFHGGATNLDPADTNTLYFHDVFVRDRLLGVTELVNVSTGGVQGNGNTTYASISADGRYVSFQSTSNDLVAGDSNSRCDIFLRDRQNSTTSRVSVASGGGQVTGDSMGASVSADGRYVAFDSLAADLVFPDGQHSSDVFVHDRQAGTTERVSESTGGAPADGESFSSRITADGRYVVFLSMATNLVAEDTNHVHDIFLRDRLGASGAPMVQSCLPGTGGVMACPCGQPANSAGGCANFGAGSTSGAVLNASGDPDVSADTLVLTTSNHRSPAVGVLNVFFSYKPGGSTPNSGTASGAGLRCYGEGGSLRRLYTVQVFGGSASVPGMGDLSISARSAAIAGHAITAPETRHYFNVYRDGQAAGPCGNSAISTNLTNMGSVLWVP